jgi:hypothetical protein
VTRRLVAFAVHALTRPLIAALAAWDDLAMDIFDADYLEAGDDRD